MMKKNLKSTSHDIRVIAKNGRPVSTISRDKAVRSVKMGKSKWIDSNTIQVVYYHKDERKLKQSAWERDNYTCVYCELEMSPEHPLLTVDHIIPKRLGGSILLENLGTCCRPCNSQKGHRTFYQFFIDLYCGLSFILLSLNRNERRIRLGSNKEKEEKENDRYNNA